VAYLLIDIPTNIRKRKLSLAAIKLQSEDVKIIDLAVMYGYDSADGFARAFAKQHGIVPSVARQAGINLTIFPPLNFQIKIKGAIAMNWRIEEKDAFKVFGIERIFSREDLSNGNVPRFWAESEKNGGLEKLYDDAGGIRNADGSPKYSDTTETMCIVNSVCDYKELEGGNFAYMICAFANPNSKTDGYEIVQIPKTTWAVFRSEKFSLDHIGQEIPKLFNRAYSEWLPTSGYDRDNRANVPYMEIYYRAKNGDFLKKFGFLW